MAATITNVLQPVSVVAERAHFAQPEFTCIDTGTHTALDANQAPPGNQAVVRMLSLVCSVSAAPASALTLQVLDDTTVIWQCQIGIVAPFRNYFDFSQKPLRASFGKTLHATLTDPGVGIVATVSWEGDYLRNSQG